MCSAVQGAEGEPGAVQVHGAVVAGGASAQIYGVAVGWGTCMPTCYIGVTSIWHAAWETCGSPCLRQVIFLQSFVHVLYFIHLILLSF